MNLFKIIKKHGKNKKVFLEDMREYYKNIPKALLEKNPLIYEVCFLEEEDLSYGITTIYPGKISKNFFMTKGHYHSNNSSEIYFLISGKGKLVIKKGNDRRVINLVRNFIYIPPGYGHRVINTGNKKLVFLSIYSSKSKPDYERVKREGL